MLSEVEASKVKSQNFNKLRGATKFSIGANSSYAVNVLRWIHGKKTSIRNALGDQKIFVATSAIFIVLLVVFPEKASASELSLTISPPIATHSLNPGETTQGVIKLTNNTPAAISFEAVLNDFIVEDSKGTPVMLDPNTFSSRFSASLWITLDSSTFTLEEKQTQEVFYTINVPSSARPGGHYASILFSPIREDSQEQNRALVETQVGALISISVKGHISEHSQITKLSANAFQEYGPINLFATIKNFGDLHIRPVGKITVSDLFGRNIDFVKIEKVSIFPEASRDYEATLGTRFMVGRFKANLSASYGINNDLPLEATLYFWIFPWKIALVVMLAIITIILAIIYFRRRYSNLNKNQEA